MSMNIPRAQFPNPQFERKSWQCLNGRWDFEYDSGDSGEERFMFKGIGYSMKINVPFAPESILSGVHNTDFINCVWYSKAVDIPADKLSGRILLKFGAVDYHASLWINERYAGFHRGGSAQFCFDITPFVKAGENTIVLRARDDVRSGLQPGGKQSDRYKSYNCRYTRVTGIWQSVWLEFIDSKYYIKNYSIITEPDDNKAYITAYLNGAEKGGILTARAYYKGELAASPALSPELGASALGGHEGRLAP